MDGVVCVNFEPVGHIIPSSLPLGRSWNHQGNHQILFNLPQLASCLVYNGGNSPTPSFSSRLHLEDNNQPSGLQLLPDTAWNSTEELSEELCLYLGPELRGSDGIRLG